MSKGKIIAVAVVFVLAIAAFVGINTYRNRMVWNKEGAIGNTSGNLLNGGLFCEGDGVIYFSNPNDDGNLYSMNMECGDLKMVYNDRAEEINYAGNYLVYSRKNYEKEIVNGEMFVFNTKGLYRLQLNDKKAKCLYDGAMGVVSLIGNEILYQHYNDTDGIQLYGIKLDGSNHEMLSESSMNPSAVMGQKVFYASDTESGMFSWDIDSGEKTGINGKNYYGCVLAGGSIYTLDLMNGYTITRMDLDGGNEETVVDEMCSVFNVSEDGDYIYYQVDDGENPRLECKNLDNGNVTVIKTGNFNRIHLIEQYIFFSEYDEEKFYVTTINDLSQVKYFSPGKTGN
jgi:hypothetical protein